MYCILPSFTHIFASSISRKTLQSPFKINYKMKALKNLTLTLIVTVLTVFAGRSANLDEQIINKSNDSKSNTPTYIKAVKYKGRMIAQVTLPEVTISAERNYKDLTAAIRKGNNLIPLVELQEVVITAEKSGNKYYVKTVAYNGELIPLVDLPEVVITAERINAKVVAILMSNNGAVPVVELPEVIITASCPENKMLSVVTINNQFMAVVNLPVVEISAEKPEAVLTDNADFLETNLQLQASIQGQGSENADIPMYMFEGDLRKLLSLLKSAAVKKMFLYQ